MNRSGLHKGKSIIARLPKNHMATLGRFLGNLAYTADPRHRRIVRRNLRFAFPEWAPSRVDEVSRRVFQNMGVTALEILQMLFLSREDILQMVQTRGHENLQKALEHPKGAIMITAHIGNWEMAYQLGVCYVDRPVAAVARPIEPAFLDRFLTDFRTRFGSTIIKKKRALRAMARTLFQGNILGLLVDQGVSPSEGVEVSFFGRRVLATPAVALLARRYGSPVFPIYCVRQPDNQLLAYMEPPLQLVNTRDQRADIVQNTQIMMDSFEKAIRTYPEQWFWFHKRWKHHYPELYPEDLAKRQRRREKRWAKAKKEGGL
jgi:KDO2-lipid IV(A) lauroyltransferase